MSRSHREHSKTNLAAAQLTAAARQRPDDDSFKESIAGSQRPRRGKSGLFGHTRQSKSITKSTLNKFFWAKEKCLKKFPIFYFLCPRCTINSDWSKTSERRLKSKFFKPGLDQLRSTFQKLIFEALFSG